MNSIQHLTLLACFTSLVGCGNGSHEDVDATPESETATGGSPSDSDDGEIDLGEAPVEMGVAPTQCDPPLGFDFPLDGAYFHLPLPKEYSAGETFHVRSLEAVREGIYALHASPVVCGQPSELLAQMELSSPAVLCVSATLPDSIVEPIEHLYVNLSAGTRVRGLFEFVDSCE